MVTIGKCRFDRGSGEIVSADGAKTCLGSKLLSMVCQLLDAPSHQMTASELQKAIWPGQQDRDNNLHNLAGRLRSILGEDVLPRVSAEGVYRLVLGAAEAQISLTAENILSSIVLGHVD